MKKRYKFIAIIVMIISVVTITSCANAHISSHAGVDVVWGSHGPRVVPSMGIDVYGGGRR
ncbi:hypothetical protein [Joostella sp. CR20]|uniref:hypothetical protein n=1 Tax=Joostella sp. CR20 TaxID=2804312 RepID=UPI00313D826D